MPRIVDNGVENLESGGDAILSDVQGNRVSPAYRSGQDVPQYDSGCAGALGGDSVSLRGRTGVSDAPDASYGSVKPLCIDLFCGLGGWSEGFLAEGYRVVGFDIERRPYPAQLVIQDVLTIHGSQFKDAAVIVASPPCQNYSYLAMPWSRSTNPDNSKAAKALRLKWETEGPDNRLFDACFRIQREAIEARHLQVCCGPKRTTSLLALNTHGKTGSVNSTHAGWMEEAHRESGHKSTGVLDARRKPSEATAMQCKGECYIPLIVENVRGAIPWVGRSAWNYGSFHLWGDVPALMPINFKRGSKVPGFRFDGSGRSFQTASVEGMKGTGQYPKRGWTAGCAISLDLENYNGQKVPYSDPRRNGGKGVHLTSPRENAEGTKIGGDWFRDPACHSKHGSRSSARKLASAQIAKIPLPLAQHIAQVYFPRTLAQGDRLGAAAGKNKCL